MTDKKSILIEAAEHIENEAQILFDSCLNPRTMEIDDDDIEIKEKINRERFLATKLREFAQQA